MHLLSTTVCGDCGMVWGVLCWVEAPPPTPLCPGTFNSCSTCSATERGRQRLFGLLDWLSDSPKPSRDQKWRGKKNPSASWWDSNPIDHRSRGTAGRELKACPWQFISDKGRTIALRQSILTTEQTSAPFPSGVVSKHFYSKEQAALIGGLPLPHWLPLPR